MNAANEIRGVIDKWTARGYIEPGVASDIGDDLIGDAMNRLSDAEAAAEQYGEQLEAVGEELDRWKAEVRLVGKNREHAERLEEILEGERS